MHPTSECYRIEYGASFGPLMAAEDNEFFLDKDMYRFIRSTILLSR